MLEEIPGVVDAFCGVRTILHMGGKEKPDAKAVRKVLEGLKVKVKGDLALDPKALF
ncbi:MAG: hypothetical protein QF903_07295 [Planctomycetota bacterium]|nr:hypothetical protein [Planctomycetota bacterium]MDP6762454.1 hypothetical protein [Planctomycetota bacterium]MDP6989270.1 hypothetical protein [Planctomycetota bacterium]